MPSGFHIGDGASVYTRAPCQLDLRPTQPAACRLYVRTFHSLNVLRGTPLNGEVVPLHSATGQPLLTNRMST